jgi:hypothetical protein
MIERMHVEQARLLLAKARKGRSALDQASGAG